MIGPSQREIADAWQTLEGHPAYGRLRAHAEQHTAGREAHAMPNPTTEARLACLSEDAAAAVVAEHADYFGAGPSNTVRQDGAVVVIDYFDKRWPLDIAEWAAEQGHASDSAAAGVIAGL
jgi:hypothetical protein